jgi:hypothetical protein
MKTVLFKKPFIVVAIVGLALGLSVPAFAQITLQVVPSSAPNAYGSPSWAGYTANALNSLQNNLGNIGSRATDPTAYEMAGPIVQPGDFVVTSFNSWQGVVGPLAAPFNSELGNRMHFGLHAYGDGTTQFSLSDLTFNITSSDGGLDNAGDFIGLSYNGTTRFGVNWGADRAKGGGDDTIYTSGNGLTLVYVGVGNAYTAAASPDPYDMQGIIGYINDNAPFTITGSYSILGDTGSATVTVIPEPSTLALLGLGLGGLALIRKRK